MKTNLNDPFLVAPCGINCRLCYAYIREKKHCPGCRGDDALKMPSCLACGIKNCEKLAAGGFTWCYECESYPCERIKHLDKRYRLKYANTVIGNLAVIQRDGVEEFVRNEDFKWACPQCGAILCMHKPACLACGYAWNT